ncbi:uncharacterized protein LOC114175574 [Vigna unguiculata]|nr:uncharacterized protein LOC114175574 [Vigna unguiculata]XP_027916137.1 uncharacterized protein LOC114175574 [Vigna unguiculata]
MDEMRRMSKWDYICAVRGKGSTHTSKVNYIVRRGQPYLWVPENDMHNVNTIIDERGSFAVASPFPGPLGALLKSLKKLPPRIALSGDVLPLKEEKAKSLAEKLQEVKVSEQKAIKEFSYTVSGVLSSSASRTSRSDNLQGLLGDNERYTVYRFKTSFNPTDSYIWFELYGPPSDRDVNLIGNVIQSWYVMGRLGAFNSSNLQITNSSMEFHPLYDADKGFKVMPSSFHDINDIESHDNWGRVWIAAVATGLS